MPRGDDPDNSFLFTLGIGSGEEKHWFSQNPGTSSERETENRKVYWKSQPPVNNNAEN